MLKATPLARDASGRGFKKYVAKSDKSKHTQKKVLKWFKKQKVYFEDEEGADTSTADDDSDSSARDAKKGAALKGQNSFSSMNNARKSMANAAQNAATDAVHRATHVAQHALQAVTGVGNRVSFGGKALKAISNTAKAAIGRKTNSQNSAVSFVDFKDEELGGDDAEGDEDIAAFQAAEKKRASCRMTQAGR